MFFDRVVKDLGGCISCPLSAFLCRWLWNSPYANRRSLRYPGCSSLAGETVWICQVPDCLSRLKAGLLANLRTSRIIYGPCSYHPLLSRRSTYAEASPGALTGCLFVRSPRLLLRAVAFFAATLDSRLSGCERRDEFHCCWVMVAGGAAIVVLMAQWSHASVP
jgi:hypothetical protein